MRQANWFERRLGFACPVEPVASTHLDAGVPRPGRGWVLTAEFDRGTGTDALDRVIQGAASGGGDVVGERNREDEPGDAGRRT